MKLRIVEDPEGCGKSRWFKLECWDGASWRYVESGVDIDPLEDKARRLMISGLEPIVVKEFNDEPPELTAATTQPVVNGDPEDDIPF